MGFSKKEALGLILCFIICIGCASYVLMAQPPPINTIQHNQGLYYEYVGANHFYWQNHNLTAFFEALFHALGNLTLPGVVFEETVEWGLVLGTSGDWFNHTLPAEPVAILLQMHNTNYLYDGVLVIPVVYDKTTTQWQLGLFWVNGTQIDDDLLIMYHMRWEPGLQDPNEPQHPVGWQEPV